MLITKLAEDPPIEPRTGRWKIRASWQQRHARRRCRRSPENVKVGRDRWARRVR
jgi:hypothetical protein